MYDSRRSGFQVIPPIVKNLIIINVILAFAQHVLYGNFHIDLGTYLGLHYFKSELFRPWQLITHQFMHGDPRDVQATLLHLFSNMFALWMFGSVLENRWGPKRFLTFYIICGLGAAACHLGVLSLQYEPVIDSYKAFAANPTLDQFNLFVRNHTPLHGADDSLMLKLQNIYNVWMHNPADLSAPRFTAQYLHDYIYGTGSFSSHTHGFLDETTVGASGAVFGVLFAFGYLFPNLRLMLLFPPIPIKAKWFILFYGLFELISGIQNSAGDNVAHFAHLGGMLFAFILLRLWKYRFGDRYF
jgi:membrane associated rhomboid family serine protease